jgi:hypothetical protein
MKLQTILTEQHLEYSRTILRESCDGLTTYQRTIVEGIYKDSLPLIEATLTAAQIEQLFGEVEKSATAGGGNRTGLGKGVDAAKAGVDVVKKADETINKIGKWLQNTTPVKGFDQKFEDLKTKIGTKFPELDKRLTAMGTWAKENPGKTAAIVGVLTTIASFAGGPVGGAIAGQILRGAVELLKGEKLSTAIGKGIKTAAYGAMAGWLLDGIGDWLEGLRAEVVPYDKVPGLVGIDVGVSKTLSMGGTTVKDTIYKIIVPEDLSGTMMATVNAAKGGDVDAFNQLLDFSRNFSRADYLAGKGIMDAAAKTLALQNDAFLQGMTQVNNLITAAAQGSIAGKMTASDVKVDGKPVEGEKTPAKESWEPNYYVQTRPLTEGQVGYMFKQIQLLNEGPMDWIKKKATNLTTKVTADKLMSAWKKAGSPTDSNEVAEFLKGQGIVDDAVAQVYQTMKLPSPGTAEQPAPEALSYKQVLDLVNKLPVDRKVRLMKFIEKTKNTEPTAKGTVDNSKTKPTTA